MARPIWTGVISFGLVSVPVRMYTAIGDHTILIERDVRIGIGNHSQHGAPDFGKSRREIDLAREGMDVPDQRLHDFAKPRVGRDLQAQLQQEKRQDDRVDALKFLPLLQRLLVGDAVRAHQRRRRVRQRRAEELHRLPRGRQPPVPPERVPGQFSTTAATPVRSAGDQPIGATSD